MKTKYIEPETKIIECTTASICVASPPAVEGGTNTGDNFPWQGDGTEGEGMDAKKFGLWDDWED